MKTRTWARGTPRIVTAYEYGFDQTGDGNDSGDLVGITYQNDGGVPFGAIPAKYQDFSEWRIHDSRWLNDRIGLGRWSAGVGFNRGGVQFGRAIFYHP